MCLGEAGTVSLNTAKTYTNIKIQQLNASRRNDIYLFSNEHLELDSESWNLFTKELVSEIKDNLPLIPRIIFACINEESKLLASILGESLLLYTFDESAYIPTNWAQRIRDIHASYISIVSDQLSEDGQV